MTMESTFSAIAGTSVTARSSLTAASYVVLTDAFGGFQNYRTKNDGFLQLKPGATWKAESRGACLVSKITALFQDIPTTPIHAYDSAGTTYSKFFIVPIKSGYRIMSDHEISGDSAQHYPYATILNSSPYPVTGKVSYGSVFCEDDTFSIPAARFDKNNSLGGVFDHIMPSKWQAESRGACLIDKITATGQAPDGYFTVEAYESAGTSYGNFFISSAPTGFRVWSDEELKQEIRSKAIDKSPGFFIDNKTKHKIAISLDNVGCLYHGVVEPGKSFRRDTASWWYTIQASISLDGSDPVVDDDCVVSAVLFSVSVITTGGLGGALGGAAEIEANIAKWSVENLEFIGNLFEDNGVHELKGQYAGYAAPFRCDEMPHYTVTGGEFEVNRDADGNLVSGKTTPIKLTKINDCGDNMMKWSPQSDH